MKLKPYAISGNDCHCARQYFYEFWIAFYGKNNSRNNQNRQIKFCKTFKIRDVSEIFLPVTWQNRVFTVFQRTSSFEKKVVINNSQS